MEIILNKSGFLVPNPNLDGCREWWRKAERDRDIRSSRSAQFCSQRNDMGVPPQSQPQASAYFYANNNFTLLFLLFLQELQHHDGRRRERDMRGDGNHWGVNYTPRETHIYTFVFLSWQVAFYCLYTEISVFILSLSSWFNFCSQ